MSVTFTVTVLVPVAVGVHDSEAVLVDVQPVGRPVYAYDSVPVPPAADVVSTVAVFTVTGFGLAANDEMTIVVADVTASDMCPVALWLAESVTLTYIVYAPATVGVHESVAVLAVVQPVGRLVYAYESVPVPPVATTVRVVAVFTVTGFGLAVNEVTVNVDPAVTFSVSDLVAVLLAASVTVTVTEYVPTLFGVHARLAVLEDVQLEGSPVYA